MSERAKVLFIFSAVILCGIGAMFVWQWVDNDREIVIDPADGMFNENKERHYYPPIAVPDSE